VADPRHRLEQLRAAKAAQTPRQRLDALRRKKALISQPDPTIGQEVIGGLETAGSIVSGALAEPVAGVAGVLQSINPFADEGAGAVLLRPHGGRLPFSLLRM